MDCTSSIIYDTMKERDRFSSIHGKAQKEKMEWNSKIPLPAFTILYAKSRTALSQPMDRSRFWSAIRGCPASVSYTHLLTENITFLEYKGADASILVYHIHRVWARRLKRFVFLTILSFTFFMPYAILTAKEGCAPKGGLTSCFHSDLSARLIRIRRLNDRLRRPCCAGVSPL